MRKGEFHGVLQIMKVVRSIDGKLKRAERCVSCGFWNSTDVFDSLGQRRGRGVARIEALCEQSFTPTTIPIFLLYADTNHPVESRLVLHG